MYYPFKNEMYSLKNESQVICLHTYENKYNVTHCNNVFAKGSLIVK